MRALAKAVGVSKWTAYDILKEIEKSGYVTRSYASNLKETGRSQVVFAPTEKATALFKKNRIPAEVNENWEEIVRIILEKINRMKHFSLQEIVCEMLKEVPKKKSNLEFCGSILGFMMVYLKKVGGKTEAIMKPFLDKASNHHATIQIFVSTILGTVIQTVNEELSNEIIEHAGEYASRINRLTSEEQALLSHFLQKTIV